MTGPARGLDTVGRPEEGLSDPCPLFAEGLSRANAWKHHLGLRCWLCRADQCRDSALGSEGPPLPAVGEHAWAMGGGQLCAIASVTDWRYRSVCQVHTCCPVLPSLATSPLTPSSLCLQTIFPCAEEVVVGSRPISSHDRSSRPCPTAPPAAGRARPVAPLCP